MNDFTNRVEQEQLTYSWNISRDFPQIDAPIIERTHMLETIVQVLSRDTPVVFLEGEDGCGATTTLAQFCQSFPNNTFSLFIKPASRFAYNLDYLRLSLYEQFYWYLNARTCDRDHIDISEYDALLLKIRRKKTILYFVVDGLHQIPSDDHRVVEQIIRDILPIGIDNFRFLISGAHSLSRFVKCVGAKPYQQLKFSPSETEHYLSDLVLTKSETQEIIKLCKGIPGRLASVKRLIRSGTSANSILNAVPSQYLEFIKMEFEALDPLPAAKKMLVAVLAFGKRGLSEAELLDVVTGATEADLADVKQSCRFLTHNPQTKLIEFVSESHRRFAEKRLETLQKTAISLQVEHLLRNPRSSVALRFLPTYYQQLNRQQSIVDLLSTEHYSDLLETTQSITVLRNRAELGVKSATLLRQATHVFKFALQRSIFIAIANRDGFESEVRALVALGQPQRALELAGKAGAKEDKLSLLAAYARRVKEKDGVVELELISYIQEIASQIDFAEFGDKAMEIAANILFIDPDLAISIVDQVSKPTDRAKDRDAAFAHLSITASLSNLKNRSAVDDKARQQISDESLQKVMSSFAAILSDYSASEIIKTVEQMEASHRLYFITNFITVHQKQSGILDVVEYGLDLMIRNTAYSPKARDLAELARPLPHVTNDFDRLKRVITRFDSQLGLIQKAAVSKDIVKFQMRLARAEMSFDQNLATDRIEQTYYDVASLTNPEVSMECYALMLRGLEMVDKSGDLERKLGYRSLIKNELTDLLERILAETADHFKVVRGALRALAQFDAEEALDLSSRLNIEDRRDEAYREVARIIASQSFSLDRELILTKAIKLIVNPIRQSEAIRGLIDIVAANQDRSAWLAALHTNLAPLIEVPELACEFAIDAFKVESAAGNPNVQEFEKRFAELINKIDSKIVRIDLSFCAVEALAAQDKTAAIRHYDTATQLKSEASTNSTSGSEIFEACLALLSRALGPIIKSNLINDDLLTRFSNIVELLPCAITRGEIYAELAARAWCADKADLCKQIVQHQCNPLLDLAKRSNPDLHRRLVVAMFPALHCAHQGSAFSLLGNLYRHEAESALYETAMLVLRKLPTSGPYYNDGFERCKINREDAVDLLQILERITTDAFFYNVVEAFVQAVCAKENKYNFSAQQKTDYAVRIRGMIKTKLPDPRNISHTGYKITSLAQVYRLTDTPRDQWDSLIKDAEGIKNTADRGLIFITLAECIPTKYDADRKRLLENALKLFYSIPSPIDRLARLQIYSKAASKNSAEIVKKVLQNALKLTLEIDDAQAAAHHQRSIIDIADKLEPGYADALIEFVDDDPARAHARAEIKRFAAVARVKRDIANAKEVEDVGQLNKDHLPAAAWKNLAALLAGRLEPKSPDVMTEYVVAAGGFGLSNAFPVLAWHIENSGRRFVGAKDVAEQLLPICEALLLSTEMAAAVLVRSSNFKHDSLHGCDIESPDGPMVRPGSREQAIRYLRQWLRANATDYIKYCDSYFSPSDIEFLRLVLAECPGCRVSILTSKMTLQEKKALSAEVFLESWNKIMEQDPPETEIVAIGSDGDERRLIHDRWIITNGAGLRMGTSFNSLGDGKLSELSEMDSAKVMACERYLDKFFAKNRVIDNARVSYSSFTL